MSEIRTMVIVLPISTPVTNVLRFFIVEFFIVKLVHFTVESFTYVVSHHRSFHGKEIRFDESWLTFFLIPYRLKERSIYSRTLPWILAFFFNTFLLAVHFGFGSQCAAGTGNTKSFQELPTVSLGKSIPPIGVHPTRWINRVTRIAITCTIIRGSTVFAREGYLKDESIYGPVGGDVVCHSHPRLSTKLNRVSFNISYSGQESTPDYFRFTSLNGTISTIEESKFGFGGKVDFEISGTLDLSKLDYNHRDQNYIVAGSCTGSPDEDNIIYCFLSDKADNRILMIGSITEESEVRSLSNARNGDTLRIRDSLNTFRAKELLLDNYATDSLKDGEHLAAVKLFATSYRPRKRWHNNDKSIEVGLPTITRSFSVAIIIGATSLRNVSVDYHEDFSSTEKATITTWALVLLGSSVSVVLGIMIALIVIRRKRMEQLGKLWIPVNYVGALQMLAQENLGEETRKQCACGFRYRGDVIRFGVLKDGEAALKGSSEFEDSGTQTDRRPQ